MKSTPPYGRIDYFQCIVRGARLDFPGESPPEDIERFDNAKVTIGGAVVATVSNPRLIHGELHADLAFNSADVGSALIFRNWSDDPGRYTIEFNNRPASEPASFEVIPAYSNQDHAAGPGTTEFKSGVKESMGSKLKGRGVELFERVQSDFRRIDRKAGIIRNVKIVGRISHNGRKYSEKALRNALPLYEGKRVFIGHNRTETQQRRTGDAIGVLRNVRLERGNIRGDLEYAQTHPFTEKLLEYAARMPEAIGLSHHAHGDMKDGVVNRINSVRSVDLVAEPAHGGGLFESCDVSGAELKESLDAAEHNRQAFYEDCFGTRPNVGSLFEQLRGGSGKSEGMFNEGESSSESFQDCLSSSHYRRTVKRVV